jgi:uncharacterized protein YdiU (UPF0061 family)
LRTLETLQFDNTYARLPDAFLARLGPASFVSPPYLVCFNPDAASLIGLDPHEAHRAEFLEYFSGARVLPGSEPVAMLYAGHQFGHYVSQLGDGRAILLGEVRNEQGAKWDLQVKGSGQTPFSRDGDGRAVLRSTIREYLCSEAMHGLGIPTTRALCIIGSDEEVLRDEGVETAAILVRLAPSHVRFGSFELFYYRRQIQYLTQLADHVIAQDFTHLVEAPDRYRRLLEDVVVRTAHLIAQWQAVGFAHGVMNTDNMSVLGLTLDYGPFGFLDHYDPGFIPNHSDRGGRYAFHRQPAIAHWNLHAFAESLLPLIPEEEARAALVLYEPALVARYRELMRSKLGLSAWLPEDGELLTDLLGIMQAEHMDYTSFFRALGNMESSRDQDVSVTSPALNMWATRYRRRLRAEGSHDMERKLRMNQTNPKFILRNYLAHNAIRLAIEKKDFSEIDRLRKVLQHPYDDQPEMECYAAAPPEWGRHLVVSCSS